MKINRIYNLIAELGDALNSGKNFTMLLFLVCIFVSNSSKANVSLDELDTNNSNVLYISGDAIIHEGEGTNTFKIVRQDSKDLNVVNTKNLSVPAKIIPAKLVPKKAISKSKETKKYKPQSNSKVEFCRIEPSQELFSKMISGDLFFIVSQSHSQSKFLNISVAKQKLAISIYEGICFCDCFSFSNSYVILTNYSTRPPPKMA